MNIESMEVNSQALEKREAIERDITIAQDRAISIIITSNENYLQAGEMLSAVKGVKKTIEEYFKPLKDMAHKSWKQLCNRENEELEKLTPAISHLNKQMTVWNIEQEKIRKAEENRLRAEAVEAEEERRLAEALQAEKEGNKEEAEQILIEPVFVPPPIVEKTVPKIKGQTIREYWEFEIIVEALIPREYLTPNLTAIQDVVAALKEKTNIPGIKVIKKYKMVGVGGVRT